MGRRLTREEARELLGAYALGAVDPDERAEVERHLLDDPDARAELHALQLGAAWLERSARRPAPRVWDAISRHVDDDRANGARRDDAPDTRAGRRWGTAKPAPVMPLPRSRRTAPTARTLAVAAAVLGAVVVAGGAVRLATTGPTVDEAAVVAAADRVPGATTVAVEGAGGAAVGMVVLPHGSAAVTHSTLPALPAGETYQLWALDDAGTPTSVAVLGAAPGPQAVRIPPAAATLAVTAEPRGGSDVPTGVVVAEARVPA